MAKTCKTIDLFLPLGKDSYHIYIGNDLEPALQEFIQGSNFSPQCLLVSDENVAKLYGEYYENIIRNCGLNPKLIVLPAGEETKSFQVAQAIYTEAIKHNLDRKSPIFALGGGVIGDLAGFIAATFMRGVPFVQIPTSLLAQVDSSVGGKVAINHPMGKNLIGAFYQPKAVFIDVNSLKTLPKREISTGLGEVIKYGYIRDAKLLATLQADVEKIKELDPAKMLDIIYQCCSIKAQVVATDEKENGLRAILNFGHTLAHAIETETNYAVYNHGEAVAIGMVAAIYLSQKLKNLPENVLKDLESLLLAYDLPIRAKGLNSNNLYNNLFHDKKTVAGKINWVLLDKVGEVYQSKDVEKALVLEAIDKIVD